jgi:cyclic beta-1,2-glucan synthetase
VPHGPCRPWRSTWSARGDSLALLFTPPFDHGGRDPGYVKGYVPGVRENGGQYTHAASWIVIAFALLGDGDRAGEIFSLLNPINDSATRAAVHRYKVEPYVAVADVYSEPPHLGRGGGPGTPERAGWLHRAALERILGVRRVRRRPPRGPVHPRAWPRYQVTDRRGGSRYEITVENPRGVNRGVASAELDGRRLSWRPPRRWGARRAGRRGARRCGRSGPSSRRRARVPLADDGAAHAVRIVLG